MANRIKGITIDIGANTDKLNKALNESNKSIKSTQKDLKDVNKLLKLDPKNPELLSQKQKLLNKTIEDTKSKLQAQKDAMQALKNVDSEDSRRQQELLNRDIIETEQALKKAKEESKQFGSVFAQQMKQSGKQVVAVGESIKNVGDNMTKYVTGPIVALGGASLASFSTVDKGLDVVLKKTGATGETFEEMESIVKGIASDIPTDFETIGASVGEVNTRFGSTGEELDKLSRQFIMFANLNDTDVSNSIDLVQKSLSAFGLSGEDASHMLDVLTVVAQQTGVSVDTLENGLIQNATAFQEMGLSAEQSAVLMGQMEKSGANSETVMNGLRKALKNAVADGVPLNVALTELQETIANSADSTEGLAMAYDLFGKSGDQIFGAIKSGTLDFGALANATIEADGAILETYNNTISPMEKMQAVMNELMILGYEIANAVMPTIQSVMETIVPIVESLTEKWNGLSPQMQDFIIKGALILAVVGPMISAIGGLVIGVGQLMTFAPALIGAIAPFAPMLLGIVGAITAVVAVGVTLWKNWDAIKLKASELWNSVKNTFDNIKKKIGDVVNSIKNAFNFRWSLPHIKLPHFSISGSANPLDWIKQGVPKINVAWYKRAMNNPIVFTTPTVIPTVNGLKGFGDGNGAEVVMSLNKLQQMVSNGSNAPIVNMTINGAEGQNVNELADIVANRLTTILSRQNGRW